MELLFYQQMDIIIRVLKFSLKTFTWILPGVFIVNILMELGFLKKLISPVGSFFGRFANLPPEIAAAFVTSFGSSYAGGSMLINFRDKGLLNDRQVLLSAITFSIPFHIRELFTYYIPIFIPILGLTLAITIIIKFVFVVLAGRLTLPVTAEAGKCLQENNIEAQKEISTVLKKSLQDCVKTCKRMAVTIPLASFIIFELSAWGIFQGLPVQGESLGLPSCSTACLVAYMANSVMGHASLAACYQGEGLTLLQAVKTMLWGSILAAPIFLIRFSGTYYFGIYGPVLGLKIALTSSALNVFAYAACLAAAAVFY